MHHSRAEKETARTTLLAADFASRRRYERRERESALHFVPTCIAAILAKRQDSGRREIWKFMRERFGFYGSLRGYEASTHGSWLHRRGGVSLLPTFLLPHRWLMSHNDGRCAWFTRVICNCSFNRLYRALLRLGTCLPIIRSNRLPENNEARRRDCESSLVFIRLYTVLCRVWLHVVLIFFNAVSLRLTETR